MSRKIQKQKDEEAMKDILKSDPKQAERAKKVIDEMIKAPETNL
jgi:hypothetical protein